MIQFVTNEEIYKKVLLEKVPAVKSFLWLATADLKDLHIKRGRKYIPFLQLISELLDKEVSVRLIHAKEPGPIFREEFDRYANLSESLERLLCPRVHFKTIVIDGTFAYMGSANLTGAGMGARSEGKRNFESGILTDNKELIDNIMGQFDDVWMGKFCGKCSRSAQCPDKDQMLL